MTLTLIFFLLISFWLEKTVGLRYDLAKGMSLMNLSIYFLLFNWGGKLVIERKLFDSNNLNKWLILMILVMVLSIPNKMFLGEFNNASLLKEIIYLKSQINPFILFFVVYNTLYDEKTCERVLMALFLFMTGTLLTMVLHKYGIMEFSTISRHKMGRISGMGNANAYASYLVLFVPLVFSYRLFRSSSLAKMSSTFLLILIFIGLLMTGSRGGMLALVVGVAVYMWIIKHEPEISYRKIIPMASVLMVVFVFAAVFTPSGVREMVIERFASIWTADLENNEFEKATGARTILWTSGLKLSMERPIIGHGQGSVVPLMTKKFGISAVAHNEYINYMIAFGIVGLMIYLMIYLKVFQHVRKHLNETTDQWNKALYAGYLAGLSGWMFSMLFIQLWLPSHLFWIYTAVIYKYSQLEGAKKTSSSTIVSNDNKKFGLYGCKQDQNS